MISKFLKKISFGKNNLKSEEEPLYDEKFELALLFSSEHGFSVDSELCDFEPSRLNTLVEELRTVVPDLIRKYPSLGFDNPILRFGGDCGTVHFSILQFIKQFYPELPANITLGEVSHNSETYFNFDREKCKNWMENGSPEIFDCHAWITIGRNVILDVTIGTYLNTRVDSDYKNNLEKNIFGGIFCCSNEGYRDFSFGGLNGKTPLDLNTLKYSPIIVGADSIKRLARRQP